MQGTTFELKFNKDYFDTGHLLQTEEAILKVLSKPKPHYSKWYFRILNFLTFGYFFNVKYTYTVRVL